MVEERSSEPEDTSAETSLKLKREEKKDPHPPQKKTLQKEPPPLPTEEQNIQEL